jgi:glycosyltransferase involved in cell wall biosynthesis
MNRLIFHGVPPLIETVKDQNTARVTIGGSTIGEADIARALLLYGSCDRYYFLWPGLHSVAEANLRLAQYPNKERAEIMLADDLAHLKDSDNTVLFTPSVKLHEMAHLRKCVGKRAWPISGMTHALSHIQGLPYAVLMLLEDLYSHDGLICTSRIGRKAVENILDGICEYLTRRLGKSIVSPLQTRLIPMGVNTTFYQPRDKTEARAHLNLPADQVVFLYLGRFSAFSKMDPLPLILAFSQTAAQQNKKALLVFAGDDTQLNMTPKIKAFAADLNCSDEVLVLPNLNSEEKQAVYAAADVFVSLSDNVQETFGLTIIEAMACGLPVIASDWNGYRESVAHGETGFLVPTYWAGNLEQASRLALIRGDTATHWLMGQAVSIDLPQLVHCLTILAENSELREQMGKAARQRILQYYDWPVIVRQYEELWRELMAEAKAQDLDDSEFSHGINSYDYLRVFGHYGSKVLNQETIIRLTPIGQRFLDGKLRLEPLASDVFLFQAGLNRRIADSCNATEDVTIGTLIEKLDQLEGATPEAIFQHITRLMKYGVLELRRDSPH